MQSANTDGDKNNGNGTNEHASVSIGQEGQLTPQKL